MQTNSVNSLNFNYKRILIDEIALEGLEGIGFKLLWSRISHRISNDVTEKMKKYFWKFLITCSCVEMYKLPEPAIYYKIEDRFMWVNKETGNIMAQVSKIDKLNFSKLN